MICTCSRMTRGVLTRRYLRTSGPRLSGRWARRSADDTDARHRRSSHRGIWVTPGLPGETGARHAVLSSRAGRFGALARPPTTADAQNRRKLIPHDIGDPIAAYDYTCRRSVSSPVVSQRALVGPAHARERVTPLARAPRENPCNRARPQLPDRGLLWSSRVAGRGFHRVSQTLQPGEAVQGD